MEHLPFNKPGHWWRGNLHTHSTNSDGTRSPEAVCKFYREQGYHFLSITDHFLDEYGYPITDATAYHTQDFITLPGAELHAGRITNGERWHILANGLPRDFAPPRDDEDGPEIARRALDSGAFVTVAHPNWYALSEDDVIALGDMHAIETINGISADHSDKIDSWYMLDVMLNRGRRYFALTTDDAHFHSKHNDLLRGWTWVKSESLTQESILHALKQGWFYSSSGPLIHDLQVEGNTVYVRCSPVNHIFLTGTGSTSVYHHGHGVTEAELSMSRLKKSPFFRLTIRDAAGARAWSNPVWRTFSA